MQRIYFNNLDTCRTLLALIVALGHFFLWNGVYHKIPESFFLAVDFFFVLSGFVLTQTVFESKATSTHFFISEFIKRRFFRLFPLYITLYLLTAFLQYLEFKNEMDPFYYFFFSSALLQCLG